MGAEPGAVRSSVRAMLISGSCSVVRLRGCGVGWWVASVSDEARFHGRPARRQRSGVTSWMRRKHLLK
jgi:hypothetical protein